MALLGRIHLKISALLWFSQVDRVDKAAMLMITIVSGRAESRPLFS